MIQRWNRPAESVDVWLENVELVREFARIRPDLQRDQIVEYFGLSGVSEVTTKMNSAYGYISINGIDIIEETKGVKTPNFWSGIYFQGIPITLRAVPKEGYQFSHWEGVDLDISTFETINLTLESDLQITAIFEPIP